MSPMPPALLEALAGLLGPRGLLTDAVDTEAAGQDWRRLYNHPPMAVLRPADTADLAAAVRLCVEHGVAMTPQGGNTSMVGGGVPSGPGTVVVSLARLNRIRATDPVDMTLTVEAGVTLKAAQDAAVAADCLLPLSISSEGTAQIGGVLATNAGGKHHGALRQRAGSGAGGWRRCCRTARSGTGCAGCARTTPATACANSWSGRRARWGSSPPPR